MAKHFADRLLESIERKGSPVCVGLDPLYERLPEPMRSCEANVAQRVESIRDFCRAVLETVAPIVPAVKPQIGYFEVYRDMGVRLFFDVVEMARELGLIVIGDIKRGDVGSTAGVYTCWESARRMRLR